jgi:hypothetical protein
MIQSTNQHQGPRSKRRRRGKWLSKSVSLNLASIIATRVNSLSTYRMWRTKIWISKIHLLAKVVEARNSKREDQRSIRFHMLKMMLTNITKMSSRINQLVTMQSQNHSWTQISSQRKEWLASHSSSRTPLGQEAAKWMRTISDHLCILRSQDSSIQTHHQAKNISNSSNLGLIERYHNINSRRGWVTMPQKTT